MLIKVCFFGSSCQVSYKLIHIADYLYVMGHVSQQKLQDRHIMLCFFLGNSRYSTNIHLKHKITRWQLRIQRGMKLCPWNRKWYSVLCC